MKKRIVALLLTVVFAVCFLFGCKKKTDEELVRERIDTFVTAYNDGDFEGVLACFDAKTRNTLEATFNVMGGLVGGLTGFSFDLGDLFTLGVALMGDGGEVLAIEVSEVSVDGEQAVAKGQMGFADIGSSSVEVVYVILVKEEEDWFIQDMTDEAPQGAESDDGDGDGDNGGSTTTQTGYTITSVEEFIDNRAWVKYNKSNEYYYGFINKSGKAVYSEKVASQDVYNIGQGAGVVVTDTTCKVIGSDGKVKATFNGEYEIKAYGGGYAWVYQDASTITEVVHKYGVFDYTGAWVEPLAVESEEGLWNNVSYIGDDMFARRDGMDYSIIRVTQGGTASVTTLTNVWTNRSLAFENDMAYISMDNFEYSSTTLPNGTTITSDFILRKDGTYTEIATPNWFTDGKAVTIVGDYLQITDYTKATPTTKSFTKYPANTIKGVTFVGDYGLVKIYGADEKYHFTLIDVNGNELFDPIRMHGSYDSLYLYADGNIYWNGDTRVDKTGKQTEWTVSSCLFSKNTRDYIISNRWSVYNYYALDGKKLFGGVKES